jgi:histidinol dehydrogenase
MHTVIWNELNEDKRMGVLRRPSVASDLNIAQTVSDILSAVRERGDDAVKQFTSKFDGVDVDDVCALPNANNLDPDICMAIDTAYQNISTFHEKQGYQTYNVETMNGVACKRVVRPLERVGLYVPGGTAPLVSTTLMLGIPAQLAGCVQVVLCTPCDKNGNVNPYILYAAKLCGINHIYRIGGAQAIAAMAYGTETVTKVDKIFGPGNAYVTEAKMQISKDANGAAIDMPAGPSEVCVIADETTNPTFATADLLSQAEHDPMSQVLLISTNQNTIDAIDHEVKKQLETLPRKAIAAQALENSICILAENLEQAVLVSNQYAPEHLILCFDEAEKYLDKITNAGSVFVGQWTPESAGDYASGTNHVLPTYGYARMYSGLSVEAFQKTMSVQTMTKEGLQNLSDTVESLATLEGLDAHARAVSIRRKAL